MKIKPAVEPRTSYKTLDIGWAKKTGLLLRSDNFATTNDRKTCNTSKVSEFCLE